MWLMALIGIIYFKNEPTLLLILLVAVMITKICLEKIRLNKKGVNVYEEDF